MTSNPTNILEALQSPKQCHLCVCRESEIASRETAAAAVVAAAEERRRDAEAWESRMRKVGPTQVSFSTRLPAVSSWRTVTCPDKAMQAWL